MINDQLFFTREILKNTNLRFKRFLFDDIDWQERLIFIVGMRGVGKTTLLLQHIKSIGEDGKVIYITADDSRVHANGLFAIVTEFYKLGGKTVVIDEVHKYPSWQQELKSIYDQLPNMRVLASGSSSIDIIQGQYDLSRRSMIYYMPGLSFREFLNFKFSINLEPINLDDIKENHNKVTSKYLDIIEEQQERVLSLFKEYIQTGYYPYFNNIKEESYYFKLTNALSKTLYEDIPTIYNLSHESVPKLQKLIHIVSTSVPYQPNIERLADALSISRSTAYSYLDYLEKASITKALRQKNSGVKAARKPYKVFLDNTNLYYAIGNREKLPIQIGAIREAFFLNQVSKVHKVQAPKDKGDFIVDGVTFEVGGKNKGQEQIAGVSESFVVKDEIEQGIGNQIPLWLFGFLY